MTKTHTILLIAVLLFFANQFFTHDSSIAYAESTHLYAGTSNPGIVYQYTGGTNWIPISPTPYTKVVNIESPHPYSDDYDNTWIETQSGAAAMRVHFTYVRTERNYDYVYVKEDNENIVDDYSGSYTDEWSDWVLGDTIKIQLVSDYSVVDDGFVIDKLEWTSDTPLDYAVLDLKEYNGQLYAGTTSQFFSGGIGRVYKYEGGTQWALVGGNLDNGVCALVVYQGELYAGTAWGGMRLYKYTPGTTNCGIPDWTRVVDYSDWSGTRCLYISHGYLLMGDIHYDRFGRWDGSNFYADLDSSGSCIYDYQDYGGYVYASAYGGRMWRSPDGINWELALDYTDEEENMWALEVFQGSLYMSYNNGELRATDGTDLRGTLKYTAPDGIISMATDNGGHNLYFGTGGNAIDYGGESEGTANIYHYDGTNVELICEEDEFGAGVQVLYFLGEEPEPPRVPFFSQRDQRWKEGFIIDRNGNYCGTIGDEDSDPIGCTMTCTAMLLKYYGKDTDPGKLNTWLSDTANKGYEPGGSLNWYKPAEYSGKKMQYEYLLSSSVKDNWQKLNDQLLKGYAVIVKVDSITATEEVNQHWVVVTSFEGGDIDDPNKYKINDPWDLNFDPNKSLSHYHREKYHDTFFSLRVYHEQPDIQIVGKSPIDIIVTDPEGIVITKELGEVSGMYYMEYDMEGNGQLNDIVAIPQKKMGDYLIQVVPESNALPTYTYSLEATVDGQTMVLAQDVQIQNIPPQPYEVKSRLNPANFDNDGDVDFHDYATLASHWMTADCHYPDWCGGTDLNYNGHVDFMDLSIFTENWLWKIPADIDVDGNVDFIDYAIFANHWMSHNCVKPDWCNGTDLNKNGSVDIYDLAEFAEYWLEGFTQ